MLLCKTGDKMGVTFVSLVKVVDADAGQLLRYSRGQFVARGDGADDGADGGLVVALFALFEQCFTKIR